MSSLVTTFSQSTGLPTLISGKPGLLVKIHPLNGVSQPVELAQENCVVGREANCGLVLEDDAVSRRHAIIERDVNGYRLRDLKSLNGSFVNEVRIDESLLKSGDRVRFGKQIYKFVAGTEIESHYYEVMFTLVTCDGLTQVPNKRFFQEIFARDWESMIRRQDKLAVMVMDLDKFKSVNDTYGHLAGDAVLVEFAKRARSVLRSGEFLARFGGEEFVLLCSGASAQEAVLVGERIRQVVEQAPVCFDNFTIPVTVSIGIADANFETALTRDGLIERADQALYQAKHQGRNQVCVFTSVS